MNFALPLRGPRAALFALVGALVCARGCAEAAPLAVSEEQYSTNAICRQKYCVNPVFPALQDMPLLEAKSWQCAPKSKAKQHLKFCKGAVDYDLAVPSLSGNESIASAIWAQEKSAATAYFYHLAGMKMEPWENQNPQSGNACIQAVWKMVCGTHFPSAKSGCTEGESASYVRPCRDVCESYVAKCGVKCCDESTACVFKHEVSLLSGKTVLQSGYVSADGPSPTCTGQA